MTNCPPVSRRDFIQRFMRECGLTYSQAVKVYEAMCHTFEDGVVSGSKIRVGRIGCLTPVWLNSREVHMHFKVGKGRKIDRNVQRTFNVEGHFNFKFVLYRRFMQNHQLKWFQEVPL